jgi:hypothetical protein
MDDKGKLTGWTVFLILAGLGLVIAGGALASDSSLPTWLLIGGWIATMTALNNVIRKVHEKVREREIREEERSRLSGRQPPYRQGPPR